MEEEIIKDLEIQLFETCVELGIEKVLRENKIYDEIPYNISSTIERDCDSYLLVTKLYYKGKCIYGMETHYSTNIAIFDEDCRAFGEFLIDYLEENDG